MASMGPGAIPDENDVPWNLILEMPEERPDEIAGYVGIGMESNIEPSTSFKRPPSSMNTSEALRLEAFF